MVWLQGYFLVFSRAEIWPDSQYNLGDFFPNFEKTNPQSSNLKIGIFIKSPHTHATWLQSTTFESYYSFNCLMAKVCVIANLFFLFTKKDIIVHYNKFPNLGFYRTNFPNLKSHLGPFTKLK